MCDCIGVGYTVHEPCCQIFAFCAKELCAPLDYWTKSCNFCFYQYLSLWGIFCFCFWTTFLLSISRAFLSYLDKRSILNVCFHFFYLLQLGGSHIPITDVCTWIRSGVLWLSSWCVAFVAETLYLFQLCLVSQLDLELWRGKERVSVSHPLEMCHRCCSISQVESSTLYFVKLIAYLI